MLLVTLILVGIAVAGVGVTRLWWSAQFAQALAEGRVGRSLVDHLDEFLEPYEGVQLDEPDLRALEARAAARFVDALAKSALTILEQQDVSGAPRSRSRSRGPIRERERERAERRAELFEDHAR